MTGRRGRVGADSRGRGFYELRAKPDSTEMDSLNVSETGQSLASLPVNIASDQSFQTLLSRHGLSVCVLLLSASVSTAHIA